ATLGAITAELGPGEPQLVAQRPSQRFLLRDVHAALRALHSQREEPVARTGRLSEQRGGAEKIIRRRCPCSSGDHSLNEIPPRDTLELVFREVYWIVHAESPQG